MTTEPILPFVLICAYFLQCLQSRYKLAVLGSVSPFMQVTINAAVKTTVLLTSNCRYTRQTAKYISKCTVFLVHAMKVHRGSRRITPFILNFGDSRRWADNFTLQPLYTGKEHPYPLNRSRSGCFAEKNFLPLTGICMPDRPAGSVVAVPNLGNVGSQTQLCHWGVI